MIPWTKKYQPKNLSEVAGQTNALAQISSKLSSKKPILLYGPTGTGKTSIVYALGKERNLEVFELNSSDSRNKKNMLSLLGSSIVQQSLFSRGKIVLIDDVDALSGTKDRGGLTTVISMFKETKFPIVLTCTNPYTDKLSKLRRKCTLIELSALKKEEIVAYLKKICEKENITYSEEDIATVAKVSKGDLRAAVNDLQTHSATGTLVLADHNERNRREDIQYCLRKVLKSRKWKEVYNIFDKVDLDTNTCIMWLDENLPREYDAKGLKNAYERMSRAEVFKGRIMRWQYWRYLVYINVLITSGVAFAKEETNPTFKEYKRTSRILKLWMAKQRNAKKLSICDKIAVVTHTSKKSAVKSTFPYLKKLLLRDAFIQELDLSEDEIAWLKK